LKYAKIKKANWRNDTQNENYEKARKGAKVSLKNLFLEITNYDFEDAKFPAQTRS
jgi:hypothetical protein